MLETGNKISPLLVHRWLAEIVPVEMDIQIEGKLEGIYIELSSMCVTECSRSFQFQQYRGSKKTAMYL